MVAELRGHDRLFERQVPPREGVGGHQGHGHVHRRAGDGIENGVRVGAPNALVGEHRLVALKRGLNRPQKHLALAHGVRRGEGGGHDVDQGQKHQQEKGAKDDIDDGIEDLFAGGDAVSGAATVILAMGAGKTAAKAIDEYIRNK